MLGYDVPMKPEAADWLRSGETDLRAAELCLAEALYSPCVFHCQQALEKALKAVWIQRAAEGVPPRTHGLVALAEEAELSLRPAQAEFLDDLYNQYKPSRYPDVAIEYSREDAEHYYIKTQETLEWLQQQLS